MAAVTLNETPAQAQQYTNTQEGGSIALPSGTTPDVTVEAHAYLSCRPATVGLGQNFLVNIWVSPALHVSRYFTGFKITITKPDQSQDVITLNSFRADSTGWFEYPADQLGTYKIKFDFPGAYFPSGNYTALPGAVMGTGVFNFQQSCYYTPSSTPEQEITVQSDMVQSWPTSPLPKDYWTRPINFNNRDWWPIAGNYPWSGPAGGGSDWQTLWNSLYPDTNQYSSSRYGFVPWVQAPNSAHIVWQKQGAISGLAGGDLGTWGIFTSPGTPNLIYSGRAYQVIAKAVNGISQNMLQCYDLRTGELYWETPVTTLSTNMFGVASTTAPTVIEYEKGAPEVPGGESSGWNQDVNLLYIGSGCLLKYDPWTGALIGNYSIAPLTSATYYKNGYALGVQNIGGGNYRLINFTTFSTTTNFTARIQSNVTWPWSSLGTAQDFNVNIAAMTTDITPAAVGAYYGTEIRAANILTGQELWNITTDKTMYSSSCTVADHGKVAVLMMSGSYMAWDLATGKLAWTSEQMDYPWDASGFGAYSVQSAYGMIYRQGYSGVYAFDWNDGKIVWKYEAQTPYEYETPYTGKNGTGVYSFDAFSSCGIIADGKLYVVSCEHTPSEPVTRGWGLHCINATTGQKVWQMAGAWAFSITLQDPISVIPGPIADGYLFSTSSTGYNYIFGKGQSKTTVSVPQIAITSGTSAVISGTVLDMSPAQEGTACVSAESMSAWMEYLHMQSDIPDNVIGVPVSIDAVDPNGNVVHIGDTTSDMSGTFSYAWTPTISGNYKISATFMGDESYGSSWAETHAVVTQASVTTAPTETTITMPPFELYTIGSAVAVIFAIAVAVLLLKKKP
jgi:hypothetical protein